MQILKSIRKLDWDELLHATQKYGTPLQVVWISDLDKSVYILLITSIDNLMGLSYRIMFSVNNPTKLPDPLPSASSWPVMDAGGKFFLYSDIFPNGHFAPNTTPTSKDIGRKCYVRVKNNKSIQESGVTLSVTD